MKIIHSAMSVFLRTDHSDAKLLWAQQELPYSRAPAEQISNGEKGPDKNLHQYGEVLQGGESTPEHTTPENGKPQLPQWNATKGCPSLSH
jgi:hypothetical protein